MVTSPRKVSLLSCTFHCLIFQALQKICLASHIRRMADLLHADALQQLEVALLGSPAANVINLLVGGWEQTRPVLMAAQPHPQAYTSTPPAPAPKVVPMLGISSPITTASTPSEEKLPPTTESQDVSVVIPKWCHFTPSPFISSDSPLPPTSSPSSSLPSKSVSYPVIVIPELAIPAEAYPKCLNWPGDKDYLCLLCSFQHSNLGCILTHIRKHLNITIGCPGCGKGYQNAASLCKHWRDVHKIQIVASADEH